MAAYISFQPSDHYSTKLYTGNGSTQSITGVGFQPDWLWIKNRDGTNNHILQDAVRGATKSLESDGAGAETTSSTRVTSFDSDGFSIGSAGTNNTNTNNYVSWNWKAGTSHSGATTGTGTAKTYTASVNTTSGFSITKYTGNGSTGHTIPHNLGAAPDCLIVKDIDNTNNWNCYFRPLTNDYILRLNNNDSKGYETNRWNAEPTSTVFELGDDAHVNGNDRTYIAYCFAPKKGFSKFGEYKGNGNADGPFIYTGFRPNWIMIKSHTNASRSWFLFDGANKGYNVTNCVLKPNETVAEDCATFLDILSNGFKIRNTNSPFNQDTSLFIYAAFAEFPFVSSNSKAGVAR